MLNQLIRTFSYQIKTKERTRKKHTHLNKGGSYLIKNNRTKRLQRRRNKKMSTSVCRHGQKNKYLSVFA